MHRRDFMLMLPASLLMPKYGTAATAAPFKIRTITAGLNLGARGGMRQLTDALRFLQAAKSAYEAEGYAVQTLRIATQPLADYMDDWLGDDALRELADMDAFCQENNLRLSVGPVINTDRYYPELAVWATELVNTTKRISFAINVASNVGIHKQAIRAAAEAMSEVANATAGGEGNFRFAATAHCPPGTPFFPAAWHQGEASFAIGLETPPLLYEAVRSWTKDRSVTNYLQKILNSALAPVQVIANRISADTQQNYLGIDTSPAPGPNASIGEVIEKISGKPFGSSSTLGACASITDALRSLDVQTCGYSGLMLPVLEDKILAKRAVERRYRISDLLLFSSVCGTGLDVIPLPGDTSAESLASIIGDVAALSHKYQKPLSARLLPVPGKSVGDEVSFDNPFLTDSVVMSPQ